MNEFYVYAYYEDGIPYYIGKGKGDRINTRHFVKMPLHSDRIVLYENLTESKAYEIEHYLIKYYGRECDGGILLNRKVGITGRSGRVVSDETKRKMSAAQKARKRKPMSDETKAKLSASRTGLKTKKKRAYRPLSETHKRAISKGMIGNTNRRQES